jgi:hypothetical protein
MELASLIALSLLPRISVGLAESGHIRDEMRRDACFFFLPFFFLSSFFLSTFCFLLFSFEAAVSYLAYAYLP